jgi:hypothetical protein
MKAIGYPLNTAVGMNSQEQQIIFILTNQRKVQLKFKKQTGLNGSDLELIAYASKQLLFTAYNVFNHFKSMNIQQARRSINKLTKESIVEILNVGTKGKPTVYCLSSHGKQMLHNYIALW